VIKGGNFFGSQKLANTCNILGGRIIVQQEEISRAGRSWTNPLNALQETILYSFSKFCIYCFFPLVRIICALKLESWKKLHHQHGFDAQPFEFQFLRPRGCLTSPFRILSLCFVVINKTPGFISRNNFVKKKFCIGHDDNALARCYSIFPSLRCQEVWNKTCTQLSLSQIPFQNPKNYTLGDVQRFCYHSWCDSTAIFDQISNSSNVYLNLSRFWTATSLVTFYQLPSVSKSRIPPKNIWSVQGLIHMSLLHQY